MHDIVIRDSAVVAGAGAAAVQTVADDEFTGELPGRLNPGPLPAPISSPAAQSSRS